MRSRFARRIVPGLLSSACFTALGAGLLIDTVALGQQAQPLRQRPTAAAGGAVPAQAAPGGARAPTTQGANVPGAARGQASAQAVQMPFELTPQEEAKLDQFLIQWEKHSQGIKNFECNFRRIEYDKAMGPRQWITNERGEKILAPLHSSESFGVLKYEAPDKGLFRVDKMTIWKPKPQQPLPAGQAPPPVVEGTYEEPATEQNEQWICDGKSVTKFDPSQKTVTEYQLPPEMQGKAISDGPLPFLFGAEAAKLKSRYWMRIITPPGVTDAIWLESWPQWQQDAANFHRAQLILSLKDFSPTALQVIDPAGTKETVYMFSECKPNQRSWFGLGGVAVPRTPLGWKKVVEAPPSPPQAQPTGPNVPQGTPAQATRPQQGSVRSPLQR